MSKEIKSYFTSNDTIDEHGNSLLIQSKENVEPAANCVFNENETESEPMEVSEVSIPASGRRSELQKSWDSTATTPRRKSTLLNIGKRRSMCLVFNDEPNGKTVTEENNSPKKDMEMIMSESTLLEDNQVKNLKNSLEALKEYHKNLENELSAYENLKSYHEKRLEKAEKLATNPYLAECNPNTIKSIFEVNSSSDPKMIVSKLVAGFKKVVITNQKKLNSKLLDEQDNEIERLRRTLSSLHEIMNKYKLTDAELNSTINHIGNQRQKLDEANYFIDEFIEFNNKLAEPILIV